MADVTLLYRKLLADLAAGGENGALREPLERARTAGLPEDVLAGLEAAVADAESVQVRMRELSRRAHPGEGGRAGAPSGGGGVEHALDELVDVVLRGGGPAELVEVTGERLRGALAIRDTEGRVLARTGDLGTLPARAETPDAPTPAPSGRDGHWATPVVTGEERLGELLLLPREQPSAAMLRTFERAAALTALLLVVRRGVAATEGQLRAELLTDLLVGSEADLLEMHERGRELGFDLDAAHCVAVAEVDAPRQRLAQALGHHARLLGGVGVVHRGQAVLLLPEREPSTLAHRCRRALGEALRREVTVGAAGPVRGPGRVPGAYQEARRCLHALGALGRRGDAAALDELGFVGLLLADRAEPLAFVRTVLGPVVEYDTRRGTELVRTLRAYFAAGRSAAHAKDELNVHVNTVVQRLERVATLLGPDWQRPEQLLRVELALLLLDVVPGDAAAGSG